MGFIKRTNKKYGYTPRYFEGDGEKSPFQMEHKFDSFRTTVGKNGLKSNFKNAISDLNASRSRGINRTILIIISVLVLLFLWIIDFDLSIFSKF